MTTPRRSFLMGAAAAGGVVAVPNLLQRGSPQFTSQPASHSRGRGPSHVTEIDAPTDGRDATAIIQAQIDAAPDGSVIRFSGRYRCDRTLWIEDRHDLRFEGPSRGDPAVIWTDLTVNKTDHPWAYKFPSGHVTAKSQRMHWRFQSCTNLHVRRLRIEGPNTFRRASGYTQLQGEWEPEHGFSISLCDQVLVEDVSVDSVYGDGIQLFHPTGPSTNVEIRGVDVEACGRTGVSVDNCTGVLIFDTETRLCGVHGVGCEPHGDWGANDVEIAHSRFDSRRGPVSIHGTAVTSNYRVHDCVFTGTEGQAPAFNTNSGARQQNVSLERNVCLYNASFGFDFTTIDGAVARENGFPGLDSGRTAFRVAESTAVEITGNDAGGAGTLYTVVGYEEPAHCGNVWAGGSQADGDCQ